MECANEKLAAMLAVGEDHLRRLGPSLQRHTTMLREAQRDLDYIFRRIRASKARLATQYPPAYALATAQRASP